MNPSIEELLNFSKTMAEEAGKIAMKYFQTDLNVIRKADNTPVTIADKEIEAFLRKEINAAYPEHAIVGEEQGEEGSQDAKYRWIIDPIDGTKSFMRGIPTFSNLIGLEIDKKVSVGLVNCPALDEMVYAGEGLGCWWQHNGKLEKAEVSSVDKMEDAMIVFGDPILFPKYKKQQAFERLQAKAYFCAGYCDGYGHLLVATGRAELMLDPIMSIWDCGPLPIILEEAGGFFGDWQGNPTLYHEEGISTSRQLLPEVLETIKG
ncbi:MAG: inositol monophosphatase family protein [Anaerolineales bacterium]|nr:inositol monophosphatase family protein [Anaerolineales bacterium]